MYGVAMLTNLSRRLPAILLLIILSACAKGATSRCPNLPDGYPASTPHVKCSKLDADFSQCLTREFPEGSAIEALKIYLLQDDFKIMRQDIPGKYYFYWNCGDLADFRVVVNVWHDENGHITKYRILPTQ